MKQSKVILIAFITFCVVSVITLASFQESNDVVKKATAAVQAGDASELSKLFNQTIELEILGEENFYSKSQAELLLKNFFEKQKPLKFVINHQGSKETSSFAIGVLTTKEGKMRISFFMKVEEKQNLIHQFRIELDDDKELE